MSSGSELFAQVSVLVCRTERVKKHPHGGAVHAPDFRSHGPGFEFCWRRDSAHDYKA